MEIVDTLENKRAELREKSYISFTMDTDWASEYIIEKTCEFFIDIGIPLTVFCTHDSPYLKAMKEKEILDVQIHPNFIQPSSQGECEQEIIDYCMELIPDAKVFRAHRWYASNDVYDKLYRCGIRYESNLCTMMDYAEPFVHRSGMISFPVFLEDGAFLYHNMNMDFNDTKEKYDHNGLKVINIHPMHFMVNTPYFMYTREIKDKLSREEWNTINEKELEKLRYEGVGISSYIKELAQYSKQYLNILSFKELYGSII